MRLTHTHVHTHTNTHTNIHTCTRIHTHMLVCGYALMRIRNMLRKMLMRVGNSVCRSFNFFATVYIHIQTTEDQN